MLLDDILESLPMSKKATFWKIPPKETYLVWLDAVERGGDDLTNRISEHSITFELYAYSPDSKSEKAVEAILDAHALEWSRMERTWLTTEQLYMTTYYFDFTTKE